MKNTQKKSLTFKGKINQYQIILQLSFQTQTFLIEVEDAANKKFRRIDRLLIETQQDFKCFKTINNMFNYLINNFEKIIIEEKILKLVYCQNQIERSISIQLNEKQFNQLGQQIIERNSKKIAIHSESPHKQYFSITSTSTISALIKRHGQNDKWFNFINQTEIIPYQRAKFTIRITMTAYKFLAIGFCTKVGLDKQSNTQNPQSAYYDCRGTFWQGGVPYDYFQKSDIGNVIQCEADLIQGVMRWRRNGVSLNEIQLPEEMKGKIVYFSTLMWETGTQIELFV